MKKKNKNVSILLYILIIFLLAFTSPKKEAYVEELKKLTFNKAEKEDNLTFNSSFSILNVFTDHLISSVVYVDNYILFSIANVSYNNENHIIGIGFLNNVFLFVNNDKYIDVKKRLQNIFEEPQRKLKLIQSN